MKITKRTREEAALIAPMTTRQRRPSAVDFLRVELGHPGIAEDDEPEFVAIGTGVEEQPLVEARSKPCCKRVVSPDGKSWWCNRVDGHDGEHHGVSQAEHPLAVNTYEKGRR